MSDTTATTDAAVETSDDSAETMASAMETSTEGDATLGDAGKKALDAMKAKLSKATEELAELRAANGDKRGVDSLRQRARSEVEDKIRELEEFKAKAEGREEEYKASQEAQRVRDAALATANDRIRKSEIKAAAKGVLQDPTDAYKYLDLSKFEVDDDGNVDEAAIADALAELIKSRPYLGVAQSGQRFQGSADGGARNGSQTSLDDQIAEATKAGNLQLAIALKQQRSAELLAKK